MLDVFKADGFSVTSLTDAINKVPFVPGRVGQLGIFAESGIPTTTLEVEEKDGVLSLVQTTARGAPGKQFTPSRRTLRNLTIPHIELDHTMNADQVQNVRVFGSTDQTQGVLAAVQLRQAEMAPSIDATIEYHRVGAIKGVVLDADGATLYDLFSVFGVSQETEVDFDLDNATPASGALRKKCTQVVRLIQTNLGAAGFQRIHALCGDAFWDDLIAHPEVRATYLNQQEAAQLRNGVAYETLNFGGITFENYRGGVGATAFIHTDKCHLFPVGTVGLFKQYNAPADLIETVNTIGLPKYSRMYADQNGKLMHLELQANPICICTRPKTLILGKRT